MEHSRLNWDVLLGTMPFTLSNGDLSRLMRTCHTLYDGGVSHLLGRGVVLSRQLPHISSFCEFILRQPERALRIRKLTLEGLDIYVLNPRDIPRDIVDHLPQVLGLCQNVEDLVLVEADELFKIKGTVSSVRSFKKLTKIHFGDIGHRTVHHLLLSAEMESPVTSAVIRFNGNEYSDCVDHDPFVVLARFSATLRDIKVSEAVSIARRPYLFIQLGERTNPIPDVSSYPNVRSLKLSELPLRGFNTFDAAIAFPALRELAFTDVEGVYDRSDRFDTARHIRLSSRHQQPFPWHSLGRLSCSIVRAYALALPCHVRVWEGPCIRAGDPSPPCFRRIVQDVRPWGLSLTIEVRGLGIKGFAKIFPTEGAEGIMHLRLKLVLNAEDVDVDEILVNTAQSLIGLALASFILELNYPDPKSSHKLEALPVPSEDQSSLTFNSLLALDVDKLAGQVRSNCDKLEHMLILFSGVQRENAGWKVVRSAEKEGLEELVRLNVYYVDKVLGESPV